MFFCYEGLAQSLLKDSPDKSTNGSGSETAVARRFGGGAFNLKHGGSFGGTELPNNGRRAKRQGC
jgi:hypothetical protein